VAGCARFKAPSNRLGIELMKWIILCAVELFSHEALFVFVIITVFRILFVTLYLYQHGVICVKQIQDVGFQLALLNRIAK
jgi:hypothetical protein